MNEEMFQLVTELKLRNGLIPDNATEKVALQSKSLNQFLTNYTDSEGYRPEQAKLVRIANARLLSWLDRDGSHLLIANQQGIQDAFIVRTNLNTLVSSLKALAPGLVERAY